MQNMYHSICHTYALSRFNKKLCGISIASAVEILQSCAIMLQYLNLAELCGFFIANAEEIPQSFVVMMQFLNLVQGLA